MTHESSPFAQPGAVAGRPPPQAPTAPGVFERVFSASAIGQAAGARSQGAFEAEQTRGAGSSGLSTVAHQLAADNGLNTQRILLEYFSSPEGRQNLQIPGHLESIKKLAQGSTLTPEARARRDFAAQGERPVKDVADLEFQKMEQDLLSKEEIILGARADKLGVTVESLFAFEQEIRVIERDDPTGWRIKVFQENALRVQAVVG